MNLEIFKKFTDKDWAKFSPEEKNTIYQFIKQEKKKEYKEFLKNNFFEFAKVICGYKDLEEIPHRIRSDWLIKSVNKLWLAPRGAFKSSLGTCALAPFLLAFNPELTIMISSGTYSKSLKFIDEIIGHMLSNNYISMFGDPSGGRGQLSREGFNIVQKTRKTKEQSLYAGAVDKSTTGMHPDIILADDLVDKETTTNIDQINKTIRYLEEIMGNQLKPTGFINVLGTRWDYMDCYGHIISSLNHDFEINVDKAENNDGSLYFPKVLSKEVLERKKGIMSSYMYSSQYQQEPIASEDRRFNAENIQYIVDLPQEYQHFLLVDPALTDDLRQEGCFTALVYLMIDQHNNWYVPELYNMKANADEIANQIIDIVIRRSLYYVHIEKRQMGALEYALTQKLRERGLNCSIEPLTDKGRAKTSRIEGLEPLVRQRKLFINRSDDMRSPEKMLEYQLLHFPKVHPIDLLDALSYGLDVARVEWKPDVVIPDPSEIAGTFAYLDAKIDRMNQRYF